MFPGFICCLGRVDGKQTFVSEIYLIWRSLHKRTSLQRIKTSFTLLDYLLCIITLKAWPIRNYARADMEETPLQLDRASTTCDLFPALHIYQAMG